MRKLKTNIKKAGKIVKYTTFINIAVAGLIIGGVAIVVGCKSKNK